MICADSTVDRQPRVTCVESRGKSGLEADVRVLIMGAGGVGGYYGGLLAQRGHEVTFAARGAHLAAMREQGLEIRSGGQSFKVEPTRAVERPAEAGGVFDLVLFTVKTYDTLAAAEAIEPVVGPTTAVLPLQNGVDAIDELSAVLGPGPVLGGSTQIGARILEPGVIERFSPFCEVTLGEPGGGLSERVERIGAALAEVGVKTIVSPDIQRGLWEKFMLLAPLAGLTSAAAVSSGQLREVPEGAALFRALRAEVWSVGKAADVNLPDASVQAVEEFFVNLPATHTTSMQRDFAAQRRVELEHLAGTVVRRGDALGVDTPKFDVVYAILKVRALSFGG
jgi:2-dehydropantoate 2-reductase